ncbi:MAG: chorismate-binding protein [Ginsengibacter sp.]
MKEEIQNQNKHIICLCRLLLQKGISFCLYRYPGADQYNVAIQKGLLPPTEEADFVIAPFISSNEYGTELLQKVPPQVFTNNQFYNEIGEREDRPIGWGVLPAETTKEVYLSRIHQYLNYIRDEKALKAILSRVKIIDKPADFDPFSFYKKLSSAYPETFASLFYIPGKGIWAGASPELFLKKERDILYTMALAATLPLNRKGIYKWRRKETREHDMVRRHIEHVFEKNDCKLIRSKGPYTFETGKVAHLKTDYAFELSGHHDLEQVISDLYPTPAIGGLPVQKALECINLYEGYSRNYYSGYLGETNGHDLVRLFINLRSMQIGEDAIAIFVGGGISDESDPQEEWEETIQKSFTLLEIIEATTQGVLNKNEVIR